MYVRVFKAKAIDYIFVTIMFIHKQTYTYIIKYICNYVYTLDVLESMEIA